ncbi:MAG: LPS assembly protein LptD [Arenimonas sp.]
MSRPALRLLPLCFAISQAVLAQEVEQNWNYCINPETIPVFNTEPVSDENRELSATDIQADDLNLEKEKVTVFEGNVVLQRSDQWMHTDKLTYSHDTEQFVTEGQVNYQDRGVRLTATQASGDQKKDTMRLQGVQYQFNKNLGNGSARTAIMKGETGELDAATYSTCPPGQRQWEFSANHIKVDQETARGSATNATLRLGGVPVLWLPYISFPTDDRRRSGILSPTIGSDQRNGTDISLPIYWNIAPNYDATFTPRWLSERGLMLGTEFRYLTQRSNGELETTWLPNDDLTGRDRGLIEFRHFTAINLHWFTSANLNHVSDRQYFSDFGQSLNATSLSLLQSTAGIYGRGRNWSASFGFEYWQIANPLLPDGNAPFRRLPRLQASWIKPFNDWFEFGIDAEAVRYSRDDVNSSSDGGSRVDIQPFIRMPFSGASWFFTPEIAWRFTQYGSLHDDDFDSGLFVAGGDTSPQRSLPIVSLDTGMVFEREMQWGSENYLQTFEPRFYYLYVPYRNQNNLPIFDSRDLTFDWPALFRTNRFGGADRQSDANQATIALTTRFYEQASGRERLSASLGRITYFDSPQVTLPSSPALANSGSAWVAQADWTISDNWNLGVTHQWDPDTQQTLLSGLRSQFRWANGGLFNAAYRYRKNSLEQTDMSFRIAVKSDWNLLGRWNYSIQDGKSLESMLGVEWKSCCVALRVLGRDYIRTFDGKSNFGLYIELELNGLGSFGRDTEALLDNAILGYSQKNQP